MKIKWHEKTLYTVAMCMSIIKSSDKPKRVDMDYIKTCGIELQDQEEAACMHVFRPMQPPLWLIYMDSYSSSKSLKSSNLFTIAPIA